MMARQNPSQSLSGMLNFMSSPLNEALSQAIVRLLRPLTRVMLRNGITCYTLAQFVRKVYVDVAFDEFRVPGKKQSVSYVSALTGLARKEVKRLREMDQPSEMESHERYNRAIRVISGWMNDSRFQDNRGWPADLVLEGEESSFARLVKDYGKDVPSGTMLSVLEAAGSIEKREGKISLIRRAFVPSADPVDKIRFLGTDVAELIGTIDHNLTSAPPDLHFQRKVSNDLIRPDAMPEFRELSSAKAQALLEELNRWLAEREMAGRPDDSKRKYVSLGIYYFERDFSEEDFS